MSVIIKTDFRSLRDGDQRPQGYSIRTLIKDITHCSAPRNSVWNTRLMCF